MSSYTITEPHPTVPQNTYVHSGRGGAGNTFRVAHTTTSPAGVPSQYVAKAIEQPSRFYSGRGGAGNAHVADERPVLSFEEEYQREMHRQDASVGHIGRGGAGNIYGSSSSSSSRKKSVSVSGAARRDSNSSHGSDASSVHAGFWGRISGSSVNRH